MQSTLNLDELFPVVKYDPSIKVPVAQWLVKGLWMKGRINAVFGPEKAGKSRFMNWVLVGALLQVPVLGLDVVEHPGKVLYLVGEEGPATVMTRMRRYARLMGADNIDPDHVDFIDAAGLRLDQKRYRDWLEAKMRSTYDALFIDPYRRVHGAEENSNTEMASLHNDMRRWVNTMSKTVNVLHHTGHIDEKYRDEKLARIAGWSRGATDLPAIIDAGCYIDRQFGDTIRVLRAGRFPTLKPLNIIDRGGIDPEDPDPEKDNGFALQRASMEVVAGR